ncbi:hypothetical protein CNMCM5793_004965 [Aspergillus hiratsukae]|uniref:LysM domain-containing protein n=1 Tax=Aspergillus hiratsukae TaxID=1194566 RepID=A0A8H6PFY0_9EURO|nr:hypothetical protein CNMCM5793_004965 [Aspergillus hiratsukae]KAF7170310.1 hypothetical protein CNMCM6106_005043 [Aspergillus hiratsukae]
MTCMGLDTSKLYCVIGTVTDDGPGTMLTTTTSTTTRTTTTTSSAPTNSPTMPGIADNFDGFYKISSGDQCDMIANAHGISTAQLKSWNSCSNLWLDYYICVHVPGATTTAPGAPEPTEDPGSGPSPQLPGIVGNCDEFYDFESLLYDDLNPYNMAIQILSIWRLESLLYDDSNHSISLLYGDSNP